MVSVPKYKLHWLSAQMSVDRLYQPSTSQDLEIIKEGHSKNARVDKCGGNL